MVRVEKHGLALHAPLPSAARNLCIFQAPKQLCIFYTPKRLDKTKIFRFFLSFLREAIKSGYNDFHRYRGK